MKHLVIGILAHVDAGKTTLSEAMLYASGSIKKLGRVDKGDAFLDTHELERNRGITIFSKQAVFNLGDTQVTLLDTPGHVDFSAEMERTLQVLDYGILVISGADGVQGHTRTLWRLLKKYKIPVFLFINKMDQDRAGKEALLSELRGKLHEGCTPFEEQGTEAFYENIAMSDEIVLEHYLEENMVEDTYINKLILERKIFPCFFGSALKTEGVEEFMEGIRRYMCPPSYTKEFGAKVFKIARDEQGSRLTYMKITGGTLKVKTVIEEDKVNQIRIYSGEKFHVVEEAEAGMVCTIVGLNKTYPGQGLGIEGASSLPILEPVLSYQIKLPAGCDEAVILPKLRQIEEEEPELHIVWNEELKEIQAKIMGEVQTEILKSLIAERFGVDVEFGSGNIVYKETIGDKVEGVGHFEPLRHYAEVHLILEPGGLGSGLQFMASCSEEVLDKSWQKLILSHLEEKEHRGVLTGSAITDIKITLAAGRAHLKHTEGGDFRQATYRAVRQGLREATSVLLEPYYDFRLEIPENTIGRAMTDIEKMYGTFELPQSMGEMAVLTGSVPVVTMGDYQKEVIAYTKGHGRLYCTLKGYEPCHNPEEVIDKIGYQPEQDLENPTGSVFCAHGAGFTVNWNQVKEYMHVESQLPVTKHNSENSRVAIQQASMEDWIDIDEIDEILSRTFYANKREKSPSPYGRKKKMDLYVPAAVGNRRANVPKEEYLLVDGYNIVHAWEELKELAKVNLDGARVRLMDILCNYQGIRKCHLIVVFDAYRVQGHKTEIMEYHNIHVVFTKEAETADQYIEKFAHENGEKYHVTVATSDGLEQIIIRGQGCGLLSANELREDIIEATERICETYAQKQPKGKNYLLDSISEETAEQIKNIKEK